MYLYGFHDARRVLATIAPLLRTIVGFIFFTIFTDIFFGMMKTNSELQGQFVAHVAVNTVINFVVMSYLLGRLVEFTFGMEPLPAAALIKKHLPTYVLTTIFLAIMITPIFMLISAIFFPGNNQALFFTVTLTLKILPIYIFPMVFITGEAKSAIFMGAKCLFGNVTDSVFLIFLSILVFLFEGYLLPAFIPEYGNNAAFSAFTVTCNIMFSLYIFTAATWVMREKLYSEGKPEENTTVH